MRLHSPTFGEQARPTIVTETTLRMEFHTLIKEMRGSFVTNWTRTSLFEKEMGCEKGSKDRPSELPFILIVT